MGKGGLLRTDPVESPVVLPGELMMAWYPVTALSMRRFHFAHESPCLSCQFGVQVWSARVGLQDNMVINDPSWLLKQVLSSALQLQDAADVFSVPLTGVDPPASTAVEHMARTCLVGTTRVVAAC